MEDFDTLKIEIKLQDAIGEERTFTSFKSLIEFLEKELVYWQEHLGRYKNNDVSNSIKTGFDHAFKEITNFKNRYSQLVEGTLANELKNLRNIILSHLKKVIFSATPFAETFLIACKLGPKQAQSFFNVITHPDNQLSTMTFETIQGSILAYEYLCQEESFIWKKSESEKKSSGALRRQLTDKVDEVITSSESRLNDLDEKTKAFKKELIDWKQATVDDLAKQCEVDKQEKDEFYKQANSKVTELEALYSEKLKLQKPAQYWNDRAKAFKTAGYRWGVALLIATVGSTSGLGWLFLQWLNSGKVIERFSAQHWQGIILLASVLSLVAYLIRIFGKLTFSSFHLQRDAEEREQLCYLYLALANETEIDPESRRIILQSLFSRSDSGLLSGDHGPIMPGITEVISKKITN